jgi:hypothetical protein
MPVADSCKSQVDPAVGAVRNWHDDPSRHKSGSVKTIELKPSVRDGIIAPKEPVSTPMTMVPLLLVVFIGANETRGTKSSVYMPMFGGKSNVSLAPAFKIEPATGYSVTPMLSVAAGA